MNLNSSSDITVVFIDITKEKAKKLFVDESFPIELSLDTGV